MASLFPDAGAAPPPAAATAGALEESSNDGTMVELSQFMNSKDSYARNESSAFPMTNLFIGDTRLGCKSDADEQLIIHIAFLDFVKVHSVKFTEFNNGINPEENPSRIHIYVNRENLGFEDCEDVDPTQTVELTATDLKDNADAIQLKFVKFQRVHSLTFFVEDNAGGDVSALGSLQLFGRPITTTNMKDFNKKSG